MSIVVALTAEQVGDTLTCSQIHRISYVFMAWFSMCHRTIVCQSIQIEVISSSSDYLSIHKQAVLAPEQKRKKKKNNMPLRDATQTQSQNSFSFPNHRKIVWYPGVTTNRGPASSRVSEFLSLTYSTWRRCRASCGCR
jgi:hypothetical protein